MSDGAARLRAAFPTDRPALIPYVMGGYPTVAESRDYAHALARHADILELGIPFSDPLADGATIQAAGQAALDAGTRPDDVFGIAASGQTREHSMQPVHRSAMNSGTLRRNMPLSLNAALPAGMNRPLPGSTGASAMVPSRNGVPTVSS